MEMHVPSDEGAVSEVLSDEQRDAVIDGLRDRTPADLPACDYCGDVQTTLGGICLSPPDDGGFVRKYHICTDCFIERCIPAAGFRVVPIPDGNTRREVLEIRNALLSADGPTSAQDDRIMDLLAAAYLDGQPEDRPDRCPRCGSSVRGNCRSDCWKVPDAWHVGGSGDTR